LPELGIDALFVTRAPNVGYLTGFSGSNGQLLFSAERSTFFTDGRYTEQARRELPDLERRTYSADLHAAFAEACRGLRLERVGFESAGVSFRTYERLQQVEGVDLVPVEDEIERLRWIKDEEEIALLERAQAFTDEAFDDVLRKLGEGITEREVSLELEWSMRQAGADGISFDPVVAFGENAAEPHHRGTDRQLHRGDIVLFDFGALVAGYHADMSRTVAFGEPAPTLREIHDVVRAAQRAGTGAVRGGALCREADRRARDVIARAGYGDQFSHSLGHGVGLELHEGPNLRAPSDDVLPSGAVVTVEPGVYVPGMGGVRIEDMVVVADDGCRALPGSSRDLVVV
jgi:Xaa-Pro aminopeptidase